MRRAVVMAVVSLVASLGVPLGADSVPADASRRSATLHHTRCPHGTFPDRLDVDCGYIVVPEDRGEPVGRRIRVAVAVIHAAPGSPAAEPILFLPGGPGAAGITRFSVRAYFAGGNWTAGHDIVLVDTRGVGRSTPRLGCPEVDEADVTSFYSGPSIGSRSVSIYTDALRRCHRRLESQGIDPGAYTVQETVADLESLREALGAVRWNLMATSADGILGMSYLREHPEHVRAAIVDSGMATQMDAVTDYDLGVSQNLDKVFAGCAADRSCRRAYPHLRRDFLRTVNRLNRRPKRITFPDFQPRPVALVLDGAGLYFDTTREVFPGNEFAGEGIHDLLDQIRRMSHGELVTVYREMFGAGPESSSHGDRFRALGRTMSFECSAVTDFLSRDDRREAARALPMYEPRYLSRDFDLGDSIGEVRSPAGCRTWGVHRAAPSQHRPVVSDVPVLVLAGEFDDGVPASMVRDNLVGLSHATYVEFPATGHLQLAYFNQAHRCARTIAMAFLLDPARAPDLACQAQMPPFDYTLPSRVSRPTKWVRR